LSALTEITLLTLHLGQNINKNYTASGAKYKQKIPASGAKYKKKLPCIWGKT
jgi:hypothetical protein